MKNSIKKFSIIILIFFTQGFTVGLESDSRSKKEIVVIINKAQKKEKMSINEVRNIFLKKNTDWNPVDRKIRTDEKKDFLRVFIQMEIKKWLDYWIEQKVVEGNSPPIAYKNDYTVIKFVSAKKDGIAYLYKKNLSKGAYSKFLKNVRIVLTVKIKNEKKEKKDEK